MRRLILVTLVGLLGGCRGEPTAESDRQQEANDVIRPARLPGQGSIISDGRTDGDTSLYFLFPIVPQPAPGAGMFDTAAAPSVSICTLVNGACTTTVATFPYSPNPGLSFSTTRQRASFEYYVATWRTRRNLAGGRFRATVTSRGRTLGFADIELVRTVRELLGVPSDVVGVLAGWPLPIPFRIEEAPTSVSVVIGPQGGELPLPGGKGRLIIPALALTTPTTITAGRVGAPEGIDFIGDYDFGPTGTAFGVPAKLELYRDSAALRGPGSIPLVGGYQAPTDTAWTLVPGSSYDSAAGSLRAPISHFSGYGGLILAAQDLACARLLPQAPGGATLDCSTPPSGEYRDTLHLVVGDTIPVWLTADLSRVYGGRVLAGPIDACNSQPLPLGTTCLAGLAATSSVPSVADFTASGVVTAGAIGHTTVDIHMGGVTVGATLVQVAAASVKISPLPPPIEIALGNRLVPGQSATLTATAFDRSGTPIPGASITWSTSDPAIADVVAGVARGVSGGRAWIVAAAGSARDSVLIGVPLQFQSVTGGHYLCGVALDSKGYCWGFNSLGRLGIGVPADTGRPALVVGNHQWRQISASFLHTCGTTLTDEGYCWGDDALGQLGDGQRSPALSPKRVPGVWKKIVVGVGFTCGLTDTIRSSIPSNPTNGTNVRCWGLGHVGTDSIVPMECYGNHGALTGNYCQFTDIEATGQSFCATGQSLGVVLQPIPVTMCGGNNDTGLFGNTDTYNYWPSRLMVVIMSGFTAPFVPQGPRVTLPNSHAGALCVLPLPNQTPLLCAGLNEHGILGAGHPLGLPSAYPDTIPGSQQIGVIASQATGGPAICAVNVSKELWCWGAPYMNGLRGTSDVLVPTRVPTTRRFTTVAGAVNLMLALEEDGTAWAITSDLSPWPTP